ncbi:MAG: polyprenyl diphosphate synthase [Bdellovibrionales bacterium]
MSKDPKHIAFIMDGNGRWANSRNKNRFWGHLKGSEVAQKIVEHCAQKTSIEFLTLYAFSTENWSRPEEEVHFLFKLLDRHIRKKQGYLISNNVRLKVIGDLKALPADLQESINSIAQETSTNTGLNLVLALNYGGRQELVSAINTHLATNKGPLTEETISKALSSDGIPDPDFIIRTSGEQRLSNFMLWQAAYSELYFTNTLWPDFTSKDLDLALQEYQKRNRRFGTAFEKKTLGASI